VGSQGHPNHPQGPGAYPQGPASSHPPATYHGYGQPGWGQQGHGQGYVPPPPPPPTHGAPQQHGPQQHGDGGFDDESNRRKLWRNGILAILGIGLIFWLFAWVLPPRMVVFVPTSLDVTIGEHNWEQVAPPSSRCTDPGPLAYVEELARPLVEQADSEFEFHFVVVDDEQINAFALPGGFVTVNMGLLKAAESGEEIAAVIGHEMTHVTHRHGMRAVMRQLGATAIVSLMFGSTSLEGVMQLAGSLVGQAHSRDQERDADEGGRDLLMAAGIDPIGMATFFERLEQEQANMPGALALLSTHPDPGERAETTRKISAGFNATRKLPAPPADLKCR
jgi:Zn-dependent protease with chaperone function